MLNSLFAQIGSQRYVFVVVFFSESFKYTVLSDEIHGKFIVPFFDILVRIRFTALVFWIPILKLDTCFGC